jgi:hypothetical protein
VLGNGNINISNGLTLSSLSTPGILKNNASGLVSSALITNADISSSAAIALSKLASGTNIITSLNTPTGTNANGGSISSNVLTLSFADGTNPGLVSTGAQTFAGLKTFSSLLTVQNGLSLSTTPTTSASSYDILTRNTATGSIEKILSTSLPLGSGTTAYLARWTGTNTLGIGSIRDDGTNVGVGVAPSGSYKLNVAGNINFIGGLYKNGVLVPNSPITIQNTNSLFSTELIGTGGGSIATFSNFFGQNAGNNATNASFSNFFGLQTGQNATNASFSNFFGQNAGLNATNANNSNFIGLNTGSSATNASRSNFIGLNTGSSATNASNSIFIGSNAGNNDSVNNTTNGNDFSVLIGNSTNTGGFSNSIALGSYATNTAANQFMIGSSIRRINQFVLNGTNAYFNFGATGGTSGYGFRDNSGSVEYKNNGGVWVSLSSSTPIAIVNGNSLFSNGLGAGAGSTAIGSNFLGLQSGVNAVNAPYSNFLGFTTGYGATNANNSNFIGYASGQNSINASRSIFIGNNSGYFDTVNNVSGGTSILIGDNTNTGGFSNSIAIGANAVNTATNQFKIAPSYTGLSLGGVDYTVPSSQGSTNQVLTNDGSGVLSLANAGVATSPITIENGSSLFSTGLTNPNSSATNSIFFGQDVGSNANNVNTAIFIGSETGANSNNNGDAVFLGKGTGSFSNSNNFSNFIGYNSGSNSNDSESSNFFGNNAGSSTTKSFRSNFFGLETGASSNNANDSFFVGYQSGIKSQGASNSIFLGRSAGAFDNVNNTNDLNDFSILIGNDTNTGNFSNSIALGGFAVNTTSNQFMIGSTTSPVNTTRWNGSAGTQCTITTGTGIACTSDETLKTNIAPLTNTLDSLLKLKTVSYNWLENPSSKQQIGFLAQDLEQYFPQLVDTDTLGYKSVYYAQMTPIIVEAIREMNIKISPLPVFEDQGLAAIVRNFLEEVSRGIVRSKQLCAEDVCVDKTQLRKMIDYINSHPDTNVVPVDPLIETIPQEIITE